MLCKSRWGGPVLPAVAITMLFPLSELAKSADLSADGASREKAELLLNFAKLVEWPKPWRPYFIVGVIGRDPFGYVLDETIDGRSVNGRPLMLRKLVNLEDAGDCDLVFIGMSKRTPARDVVGAVKSHPVLTVSELPGFLGVGGMIRIFEEEGRVRFELNAAAAESANLHFRSQMLDMLRRSGRRAEGN